VALKRIDGPPLGDVRQVVEGAFAHRRKTLANSLALAGIASRADVEAALAALGRSARARAEELEPPEFVELAEALR
jgi:16S rRNA (adenine1518-N6/adenine1519-N6)-dimethyltransferase